jgi:putative FmdB family regulatory protein
MPLYEFYCQSCDCCFEVRRSFSQGTEGVQCPDCAGDQVQRVFTPVAAFSSGSNGGVTAIGGAGGCGSCTITNCAGCPSARGR